MGRVRFRDESGQIRIGTWLNEEISYFGLTYEIDSVDVLPPTEPSKVILVGRNLQDSVDALGVEPPSEPRLFFTPPSAVIGHQDTVKLPDDENQIVYGAELGVVIGQQCKSVPEEDALEVIEGYTCVNDISSSISTDIDPGRVRVKGFDNAKPIGPAVVDPNQIPDDASIRFRLNDTVVQESSLTQLIYTVPEIIKEITSYITLEPGDVIAMGSPAGNGPLSSGDRAEVEIEGIPTLSHQVTQQ